MSKLRITKIIKIKKKQVVVGYAALSQEQTIAK